MRGDAAENVAAETEGASAETQPRVVTLRQMLKKASQNPFLPQYTTLVSSPSDSGGSSVNEPQKDEEPAHVTDSNHRHHTVQNGVHVDPTRRNPFYSYYLESGSKGHVMENVEREVNLNSIFVPPPEFQSSPLDLQPELHGEEPQNDLFPTSAPSRGENLPNTSTRQESADGPHHDETLNSPDLFNVNPQTQNVSRASEGGGCLQAAEGAARAEEKNLFEKPPHIFVDPFKSPPHKEEDLLQSSQPRAGNPFHTGSTDWADLVPPQSGEVFHTSHKPDPSTKHFDPFNSSHKENRDVFSSTNTFDPFSSPVERNLFQDVSSLDDPFGTTPSKQGDPFQEVSNGTPDLFSPLPSSSSTGFSPQPLSSTSEMKPDMLSSPDLFRAPPSDSLPANQPASSSRSHDIVLTTPQGTKHSVLHPTPFSQARGLSPGPAPAEITRHQSFKRPPKPLPRTRPQRRENPQIPELPPKPGGPPPPLQPVEPPAPKTSPKPSFRNLPSIRRKPRTPESQPVKPENYVVYEDILLIGQEKCVEDWPEDSPQLNPEFRPSGRLRLRRESMKVQMDQDGGSGEDQEASGNPSKKRDKKLRMSLLSRRGPKEKFPEDMKEGRSRTLSTPPRSSKDFSSEEQQAAAEHEDELNGLDYRKPLKNKVTQLLRRASTKTSVRGGKSASEYSPNDTKAAVSGESEAEDGADAQHDEKRKNKMKMKFVPQRRFTISLPKMDDEVKGATGYTPQKGSKDRVFEDEDEMKDFGPQTTSKGSFTGDRNFQETDEDFYGSDDLKPKKPAKMKFLHKSHRSSKENVLDESSSQRKKSSWSVEELDGEELYGMEYSKQKKSKHKGLSPLQPKAKTSYDTPRPSEAMGRSHRSPQHAAHDDFAEDEFTGSLSTSRGEMYYSEQHLDDTSKPKKSLKLKGFKKHKTKSKDGPPEWEDPSGFTSGDFMSEAAMVRSHVYGKSHVPESLYSQYTAEWMAAQQDERAMAGFQDEDEDGDTDSLMEWWNTVEQWDELPSDDESRVVHEDESRSFSVLADKVHRGLRVFNKVFTERAEILWQSIILLHAICDDINDFHRKAKTAGITTSAVGGVAAIAGLVLAPFTFGATLVITAVGVGVVAGGASMAASDNSNNMHDRKKVEIALKEYEGHLLDLGKILHFIDQGLYKLRGHPFLRSGTQHYSEDWETRRAVQIISQVDSPVMRATEITDGAIASVQGLFRGMDKFFVKDSRELKKGCRSEVVEQIKEVANVLNTAVMELNSIREELQDATGSV
ncbi:uncharacterized protein si:cabz01007807.1 isoform X3 [Pleuronectes platessa]|uniref:uncharacterized protein si:cabz01007807.1 isoform X3 n=1 Tax=Pleuronectes platessa TaxID=8262 RepID=UPI00232A0832|nr:uncharacterized protein si:cabz01007807.1 isoform X3 [Pleuronectes platessa]